MPVHVVLENFPTLSWLLSTPLLITYATLFVTYTFFRGPRTSRDRDLHDRVVILTGVFHTALALPLLEELANRGAHVIGLVRPSTLQQFSTFGGGVVDLVEALRERTKNKDVYLEAVDLRSPASIREFCGHFLKAEKRLDAIVFTHEYRSIGSIRLGPFKAATDEQEKLDTEERSTGSLATFYLTTLLLPTLLVATRDRDIRIINTVNPLYAAALPTTKTPAPTSNASGSTIIREGKRALDTIIFTRHLQRVLDSLPSGPTPDPNEAPAQPSPESGEALTEEQEKTSLFGMAKSNIAAVTVNPGLSRLDTIEQLLGCRNSWLRTILYWLILPILMLVTRGSNSAIQSILHALFVPAKFKLRFASDAEECLAPGALYANCRIVAIGIPKKERPAAPSSSDGKKNEVTEEDEGGQDIWEQFERGIKTWDEEEKQRMPANESTGPARPASN